MDRWARFRGWLRGDSAGASRGRGKLLDEFLERYEQVQFQRSLTQEDRLQLVVEVIEEGEQCASAVTDRDIWVFIGKTGAGKTTLINYLAGCELQIANENLQTVEVRTGSSTPAVAEIGNEAMRSKTFIPTVVPHGKDCFVDCPGFDDTRGGEINIGNAVNVKEVLRHAGKVRLVFVLSHPSFRAGKMSGLSDLVKSVTQLFGTVGDFVKHTAAGSIALVISMAPKYHPATGKPMERDEVLDQLMVGSREDAPPDVRAIVKAIRDFCIVYHALDRAHESWPKRDEVWRHLRGMLPIEEPAKTFNTVITPEAEATLVKTIVPLRELVVEEVRNKDYAVAARLLRHVVRVARVLEHSEVTSLLRKIRGDVLPELDAKVDACGNMLKDLQEQYWWIEPSWLPLPKIIDTWMKNDFNQANDALGDLRAVTNSELGHVVSSALEHQEWAKLDDIRQLQDLYEQLLATERGRRARRISILVLLIAGVRAGLKSKL